VHGILLAGGSYVDHDNEFNPVITRPTTDSEIDADELQIRVPAFWPAELATLNNLETASGLEQTAVFIPGQFRATNPVGTDVYGLQRIYPTLTFNLLEEQVDYEDDWEAPEINGIDLDLVDATTLDLIIDTEDEHGIARIVVVNFHDNLVDIIEPVSLPSSGPYTIPVEDYTEGDRIIIQVVDNANNVAVATAKGADLYAIDADAGPDRSTPPNTLVDFTTTISNKDRLEPPVTFIWEFGDGTFLTRQLTEGEGSEIDNGVFTVQHAYSPTDLEFTATLRIFDYDGGLGYDEVIVTISWEDLLKNAITSFGDVSLGSNSSVSGPVVYGGDISGEENVEGGDYTQSDSIAWPESEDFINYYLAQVSELDPILSSSMDLNGVSALESLYRIGDLIIDNTEINKSDDVTLNEIIYVDGNLAFAQPGNSKAYTIDLNGATIFATGNISFPSQGVSLKGSGCIIAVGDINFQPAIESGNTDSFIAVISLDGEVSFNPNANFFGAVIGQTVVSVQPDCSIEHPGELYIPDDLNFPG
jgi:hypothetical protein